METRSALLNQPDAAIGAILDDLDRGKVIPVLGTDLFQVKHEGMDVPLHVGLARACAQKLELPDAGKFDSINQVFVQYLGQGGIQEEIYEALERVGSGMLADPPDWLVDLAGVKSFKLFVTTTFVDVIERAIEKARGVQPEVKAYAKNKEDLATSYDKLDRAVVYHLFGKLSPIPDYVASEQDALEFLSYLQDRNYQPANLIDALRTNNLLLLGCRFPDWVTRFFLRGIMGKSLLEVRNSKKYLVESSLEAGQPLVMFLSRFSFRTSMIATEPTQFVRLLTAEWRKRSASGGAGAAAAASSLDLDSARGSVFVSYASEDGTAARNIVEALERNRIPVWYDKNRLKPGDTWDARIETAVKECAYFLPLISSTTERVHEGYFRKEWSLAADRATKISGMPFILPVVLDDTPLYGAPGAVPMPRQFRDAQWAKVPEGRPEDGFLRRMIELMREYRVRAESGRR